MLCRAFSSGISTIAKCAGIIRKHSRAPVIALADQRSLEQTLVLFDAGIDDVLPKPVHVREILARSEAIWRRVNGVIQAVPGSEAPSRPERLRVFFDGRDPEIDGEVLPLPRRERHILEYLVRNRGRRLTKTQVFNVIYGVYSNGVEESVVEGHVSKLRKKLTQRLGYDPIEAPQLAAALLAAQRHRLPDDADYRTPWERGDDAALPEFELAQVRRSAQNLRALGLL